MLEQAAVAAWMPAEKGLEDSNRRAAVRQSMIHAWHGYETYAWGADELQPESKTGKFGVMGGMSGFHGLGASIIDAMSTLHVMELHGEFERAQAWVVENMTFSAESAQTISFFETTIRVLGGLLAAHDLTGRALFLEKAEDLGARIAPVFQGTASGLLNNRASLPMTQPSEEPCEVALAEAGTNLIEFGTLSERTGNETYRILSETGMRFLYGKYPEAPLLGASVNRRSGQIVDNRITLGAPTDSYFEYLLKYWILTGKQDDHWRQRWVNATDAALDMLSVTSERNDEGRKYTFVGEVLFAGGPIYPMISHLGCFYPGNIALGVISGAVTGKKAQKYLRFAGDMAEACYSVLYNSTKTGLGAESAFVDLESGGVSLSGLAYFQRPEVVESLFYLWRATHDAKYRDWGWSILQAVEKHCRKEAGYSGVVDVETPRKAVVEGDDTQQSWFLAETLKYLFLLFSDDGVMPLDEWVFNTEAHPVRVTKVKEEQWIDWSWASTLWHSLK